MAKIYQIDALEDKVDNAIRDIKEYKKELNLHKWMQEFVDSAQTTMTKRVTDFKKKDPFTPILMLNGYKKSSNSNEFSYIWCNRWLDSKHYEDITITIDSCPYYVDYKLRCSENEFTNRPASLEYEIVCVLKKEPWYDNVIWKEPDKDIYERIEKELAEIFEGVAAIIDW